MNIKFEYLYRDAGNYKFFNCEIFSNIDNLPIHTIDSAIKSTLIDGSWFYANKWGLKDLHEFKYDEDLDHNWHEYESVEATEDLPTKGDIVDFLKNIGAI